MEIEICSAKNSVVFGKIKCVDSTKIIDLKNDIWKISKISIDRQSIRMEARGKQLNDSDTVKSCKIDQSRKLYVKDLGRQIGWQTVFLAEYAGPLFVYLMFYLRPSIIYNNPSSPRAEVVHIAAACHSFHYLKRIFETIFVHRFSHNTMPFFNLFKNCSYYWGLTAYLAYHINHPLYTAPRIYQTYTFLSLFLLCEYGNFCIHLALRNLRPPGTTIRRIPMPDGSIFTNLFNYVSCPNYTYEFCAWFSFGIMTQCIPVLIFAFIGLIQMSIWAIAKHKNYKKEFKNYPKTRSAILPMML